MCVYVYHEKKKKGIQRANNSLLSICHNVTQRKEDYNYCPLIIQNIFGITIFYKLTLTEMIRVIQIIPYDFKKEWCL